MERKVLTASDGMLLTNGKEVGRQILLGEHDSPENWYEIAEDAVDLLNGDLTSASGKAQESDYLSALKRFGVNA